MDHLGVKLPHSALRTKVPYNMGVGGGLTTGGDVDHLVYFIPCMEL